MDAWTLLLVFLLNVIPMYLAGQIAMRKGRSLKNWLWLGAIFGPFALIVAALPSLEKPAAA